MRRSLPSFAGALVLGLAAAATASGQDESANVKAVIQSAYIEGVHIQGDASLMRQGFHPDFRMLVLKDGKMTAVTLEEWTGRIAAHAKENPNAPRPDIKADYSVVDVTGNAAVVKVEVYRGGKHTFTDYLSLYKFPDGWKIVGKIFQAHS
jgi:Putative lumazine-binding